MLFRAHPYNEPGDECGELCTWWIKEYLLWVISSKNAEFYSFEDTHFHYLIPEDLEDESSDKEWHGKLATLERTIKSEAGKSNRAFEGQSSI